MLTEGLIRKDAAHKALFKKFLKTIKENKTLKMQFDVYSNIEGKVDTDVNNASLYVEENIKLLQSLGSKEILKANTALMKLAEGKIDGITINYPAEKKELHENISKLIFTKKNPKTIDSIVESKVQLVSHILNNTIAEETVSEGVVPNGVLSSLYVNKFNEKYSDLSEGDKKLFNALLETDVEKQAVLYSDLVRECVTLVNKNLEGTESNVKETLLSVKERLLTLEYNQETFADDVERIAKLKSTLV